ncbi:tyrosine-type recombinase/integrase [Francisella philomiragia]|uniref:tyrosine-type recombinase/integrase n=1 Tax=Francisella philomiragia TaxID=28110 RepID=UPI001C9D9D1B|nr:site-specific integrase [Francisella philomiragia]MBY7733472.1 integrase arm-type DNA-binding domain-containing protein [Francisella philomiragia]
MTTKTITSTYLTKSEHSGEKRHRELIFVDTNLYLAVHPNNKKSWIYRYRHRHQNKQFGLGRFPTVSLKKAKEIATEYNRLKEEGVDIAGYRKYQEINKDKLFENVANKWYKKKEKELRKPTLTEYRKILNKDIIPTFQNKSVAKITLRDVVLFLQKTCQDSYTKFKKYQVILSGIFSYATVLQLCDYNIMTNDLSHIQPAKKAGGFAFINPILDSANLALLLHSISCMNYKYSYKKALLLAPLVAFRPTVLATLKWDYFNQDKGLLVIPAKVMKMKQDFIQPLSEQAIDIIISQEGNCSKYIFDDKNGKAINPNDLREIVQNDLGFDGNKLPRQTMHGFRHIVSTGLYHLQIQHGWQSEAIELVLDHRKRNRLQATYNQYQYIEERREILQVWANYLDNLKNSITPNFTPYIGDSKK